MDHDVKMFVDGIEGVKRDLDAWQNEKDETGKLPTKENVLETWGYFKTLLEMAKEYDVDKKEDVYKESRNVVDSFLAFKEVVPLTAFIS